MYVEDIWTNKSHPVVLRWLTESKVKGDLADLEMTDELLDDIYDCFASRDVKFVRLISSQLFDLFKDSKTQAFVSHLFPLYIQSFVEWSSESSPELSDIVRSFLIGAYNLVLSTDLFAKMTIRIPLGSVRTPFSTSDEISSMMSIPPAPSDHVRICTQHFTMLPPIPISSIEQFSKHRNLVFSFLLAVYNQYISSCRSNRPRKTICQLSRRISSQGCLFGPKDQQRRLDSRGKVCGPAKFDVSNQLFIQLLHALHFIIYNGHDIDDTYRAVVSILKRAESDLMIESLLVAKAVRRCFGVPLASDQNVFAPKSELVKQIRHQPSLGFNKSTQISGRYGAPRRPSSSESDEDLRDEEIREEEDEESLVKSRLQQPRRRRRRSTRQSFLSGQRKSRHHSDEPVEIEDQNSVARRRNKSEGSDDNETRLSINSIVRLPFLRPKPPPTRLTGSTPLMRTMTKRRRSFVQGAIRRIYRRWE